MQRYNEASVVFAASPRLIPDGVGLAGENRTIASKLADRDGRCIHSILSHPDKYQRALH